MDSCRHCVAELAELAELSTGRRQSYDWDAVEASVGMMLPGDYKLLVETFPDGQFCGLVRANRPGYLGYPSTEFVGSYGYRLGAMRRWRKGSTKVFPYPIYPEPGGLLPWGEAGHGGMVFWLTQSPDPQTWPVIIVDGEFGSWERFDGTACEFLLELARARSDTGHLGAGLAEQPVFEPLPGKPGPSTTTAAPAARPERGQFWAWFSKGMPSDRPVNEFAALRQSLGPPPHEVASVDWASVEARLGLGLPSDYKDFVGRYGAGRFCDVMIAAPDAREGVDLFRLLDRKYQQVRELDRGVLDPPVYPEPGGMIAWGETTDGWTCLWAPHPPDDPDAWGVVVVNPHRPALNSFQYSPEQSFSTFLRDHSESDEEAFSGRAPWSGGVVFIPGSGT